MSQDEYSSDEEDIFESKSSVFLGYNDGQLDEELTIEDTFIGGQPLWLHPNSQPKKEDRQCDNCGQDMALLLQAFAPFDGKPYDRVIYVFACKNSSQCSRKKGSVKALRGISKDPKKIAEIQAESAAEAQRLLDEKLQLEDKRKFEIEITKDLFDTSKPGVTENPFGNPFGGADAGNPFGKAEAVNPFSQKKPEVTSEVKQTEAKESAKKTTPAALASDLPSYPGSFVFVEQEKFKKVTLEPELEKYKHLMETGEPDEGSSAASYKGPQMDPQTAKISSMLDDKFFENFTSVVGHNPTQVLRYDLGGKPLLYSGRDDVARVFETSSVPDPAYNPSSHRQFELQLMPKAIIDLEKSESVADILNGMSWGTIIVCTDAEDYIPQLDENHVGYVREYCGVQWEESV